MWVTCSSSSTYLSVLDNVVLPCRFSRQRRGRAAQRAGSPAAAAQALLHDVGLGPVLWPRPAAQLSVGQQQRVAAARALIGAPELVIADEPTSALDAARRDAFVELLLRECRAAGSTLVFVSHDERLAPAFDERLALPAISWPAPGTGAARSRWSRCRSRWPRCCCSASSGCVPTCARTSRRRSAAPT